MSDKLPIVLVAAPNIDPKNLKVLKKHAFVHELHKMTSDELNQIIPYVKCLLVFSWPKQLSNEILKKMIRLKFIQNILAGVNQVPFSRLNSKVIVSSNAGAYSKEVAEYSIALMLAAAKRIVQSHDSIRNESWNFERTMETGKQVTILENKVVGILGFGGIGTMIAKMLEPFHVQVYAYGRKRRRASTRIHMFYGKTGLLQIFRDSDVIMLCLPLTLETRGVIDEKALHRMKSTMILVNVARGELVDQKALYKHLKSNLSFQYATDVWWYRKGRESLHTDYPFMSLPNFIGTPHLSGPSGYATGRPTELAIQNMIRYLTGRRPRTIVNRNDYVHRLTGNS